MGTNTSLWYGYRNSSPSFRSEQTFFKATCAAVSMTGVTFRAPWGHTATQRIQEMHRALSVRRGSAGSMAWTGHCGAHRPQRLQSLEGLGTMPTPPAFL